MGQDPPPLGFTQAMEAIVRAGLGGIALVLLVACTSAPGPGVSVPGAADYAGSHPLTQPSPQSAPAPMPGLRVVRIAPPARVLPALLRLVKAHEPVSPLDLEAWSFGWVDDAAQAARLVLPGRFWSDQKPLWRTALDPRTSAPTSARRLEQAFHGAGYPEEAFRAAWHLWLVYRQAALPVEARQWLDRAHALRPGPVTGLERAWDQAFRLQDLWGARSLAAGLKGPWAPDDDRKARILRQKLFLGSLSLAEAGADGYVSTLALDRDDLWIGTWNGAVVRWSLTTETLDLLLAPGKIVAPVKLLEATGWFVYAFQDQALLRYSKVTGTWRTFTYPPGWTGLRVQGAVADGQESLWVAYLGQGLWHWDRGEWTLVDGGGGGPFLNALAADGNGGFWIGTKDRGLWSWKAGVWSKVNADGQAPVNISVVESSPSGDSWAVGTWGEGTWLLAGGVLHPVSGGSEFVVGGAWTDDGPLWGTLDEGLVAGTGSQRQTLGPLDGIPPGGVSAVVSWQGRWIWGTAGQGLGWWSEHENTALLR